VPEFGETYILPCLFPHTLCQSFKASTVTELNQEPNKEGDVSTSIDKMPSCSFVLWFPDLKSHGLCEDLLRELMLGAHGRGNIIGGVVVDDMRSLFPVSQVLLAGNVEQTLATIR